MKKLLAILMAVIIIAAVAGAVVLNDQTPKKQTETTSTTEVAKSTTYKTPKQEGAKISGAEAIDYIKKSYSKKELGLDKTKEDYSLMVAGMGIEIDGKKYVKVAANVMAQNKDVTTEDGKATYTMTSVGNYYISYDGKTILKENMNAKSDKDRYTELENRYESYKKTTTKAQATETTKASKNQTTKAK